MPRLYPPCKFCPQNGIKRAATFVAAQSTDRGKTVDWVLICVDHADGWNEGSDWTAPMFALQGASSKVTVTYQLREFVTEAEAKERGDAVSLFSVGADCERRIKRALGGKA